MKAINFPFKNDLNAYLNNEFNCLRYRELTRSENYMNLFNVLDFFNLFWYTHELILVNRFMPLNIISHLHSLELTAKQFYYFLGNLLVSFNRYIYPQFSPADNDAQLDICLHFISEECRELSQSLYPMSSFEKSIFYFPIILNNLELIPDNVRKLKYLIGAKACYKHYISANPNFHSSFGRQIDIEIKRIRELFKLDPSYRSLQTENLKENPA